MSNITEFFTIDENASNTSIITPAPSNAPMSALNDEPSTPPIEPPSASITMATPRLDPVDIPKIDGPAKGLSNVVCINNPAIDNAAPASIAVHAMGKRVSSTITRDVARDTSLPVSEPNTSPNGMSTEPNTKHAANNMTMTTAIDHMTM